MGAALLYTQDLEVYTYLLVNFDVSSSGLVEPSLTLVSTHELHGDQLGTFQFWLSCAILTSGMAVVQTARRMLKKSKFCAADGTKPNFFDYFELWGRLLTCVYCCIFYVTQQQVLPMKLEFDHAVHAFTDVEKLDSLHDIEGVLEKFFTVIAEVYDTVGWVSNIKATAYIINYVQFIQIVFYFNAHPRMAVLYKTI